MKNRNIYKTVLSLILSASMILLSSCSKDSEILNNELMKAVANGYAVIQFLDVGQADCSLISLPDGRNILIDAGNDEDGKLIVDYLRELGITKIDFLIGTHPHEDHIGGMDNIIFSFEIGKIIMPKLDKSDITGTIVYEEVLVSAKQHLLKINQGIAGYEIIKEKDINLTCISPLKDDCNSLNNYSTVLMFSYGDTDILFAGDAEKKSEREILENGFEVSADILKVGHHGSKTATSDEFFKAVNPKYSVVSVGDNNIYSLPDEEVMKKLESTSLLTTNENGSIFFILNKDEIVNQYCDNNVCLDGN